MSRYLVYTSPARGHLYPIIDTLLELHRRGHEVHVRTLSSEIDLVRSLGFEAEPIANAIEDRTVDDWTARTPMGALKKAVETFTDRAVIDAPDLQRAVDEVRPDALYIDINSWGAACTAEASDLPWAFFTPYSVPIESRDVPPFGLGLTPRGDLLGRVRDRVLGALTFAPLDRMVVKKINQLRSSLGMGPIRSSTHFFTGLASALVYYSAEPFEYPRSDWPATVRLVGPGTWNVPTEKPEWLDHIDKPIVLVTCSTEFQNDGKLIETSLEALANEEFQLVGTSGGVDVSRLNVPPDAIVEPFLPHGPLLARAACVVCHGGMGITQKALAAGVPVVAVPFGRDQFEVARRVVLSGGGVQVPAFRLNPTRLRRAVHEALGRRAGAQKVAAAFEAAGGAQAAAEVLESIMRDPALVH